MSVKKVIDKTIEVLDKQKELNDLVIQLKHEVRQLQKTYEQNASSEVFSEKVLEVNQVVSEEIMVPEVVEIKHAKPSEVQVNKDVDLVKTSELKEWNQESAKPKEKTEKDIQREQTKSQIFEFFLGKNIIAKIAIVLIFLGIFTFGNIAYIDWLNNTGRFFFILGIGFVTFGIGYLFERKNGQVFSSVFYGLSTFIIYLAFLLGRFTYGIVDDTSYLLSSIGLLILAFVYFKNKRSPFLDFTILLFYFTLAFTGLSVFNSVNISVLNATIYTVLLLGTLFITYIYVSKYISSNQRILVPFTSIISLGIIVFGVINLYSTNNVYITILYMTFGIAVLYISNMTQKENEFFIYKTVLTISSVLVIFSQSILMFVYLSNEKGYIENFSLGTLFVFGAFIPLYVALYFKNKRIDNKQNAIYLFAASIALISFAFNAKYVNNIGYSIMMSEYLRNIILLVSSIVVYVIYKLTNEETHKLLFYLFLGAIGAFSFVYFIEPMSITFSSSTDIGMVVSNLVLMVALYGINYLFKRFKDVDSKKDLLVLNTLGVLINIPLAIIIGNELFNFDMASTMTIVILYVVGFRWLMELEYFKTRQYKEEFNLFLNTKILLITLLMNFIYFDHDFSMFSDVLKFIIVMIPSIYIIYSLKEVFNYFKDKVNPEQLFILLYLVGVFIQSMFIHRFLNIEFDKVILSSYFMISSAVGILYGFRSGWLTTRRIGLFAIYYSLLKFFIYDFYTQDFSNYVRMGTYFILGFVLLGISFLYAYLERKYGVEGNQKA